MSANDNPITLAQHVVKAAVETFCPPVAGEATKPDHNGITNAAWILARVAVALQIADEVDRAMGILRNRWPRR